MLVLVVRLILLKNFLVVEDGKSDFEVLLYAKKYDPNVATRSNEISTTILKIFKLLKKNVNF